jgi:alpha-tubulin suppressor-like RCC1 family protein
MLAGVGWYGQVLGLSGVTQITAGCDQTCAILEDKTAVCWGGGTQGDGDATSNQNPTPVSGLTNVKSISAGCLHTCAVLEDGTAWWWGSNMDGELGDGTTNDSLIPVQVAFP